MAGTCLALLTLALWLALGRLARGPSLPDRAVALDLLATLSVGVLSTYAIAANQPVLLDVALAIALVGFLATVAIARYTERAARSPGARPHA
ncbi:MAG: hypothetical protein IT372_28440 [Polyangiaceae bacterium]|nr:hypothetical protein [Polyangiaceae bacterium]